MSAEDTYHVWTGPGEDPLTFGYNDTDPEPDRYPLSSANGLERLTSGSAAQAGGGLDGAVNLAQFLDAGSWVEEIDVTGSTESDRRDALNALKAATVPSLNRLDEYPFEIHHGTDTVKTVFARVVTRDIPTDEQSLVRLDFPASIVFAANDPVTYGPEDETTFAGAGASHTVTNDGWWPSERYTVVIEGPCVNPKIRSSLDASAAFRYVGTIASGDLLYIEIKPRSLRCELWPDGDEDQAENVYGAMDGGVSTRPPQWFPIQPGSQTVTYSRSSGSGGATLTHRSAFP